MKTSHQLLCAVLLSTLGGAVMAQEILPDPPVVGTPKTRAQVLAELQQARLDGSIRAGADDYVPPFKSTRTRKEVRDEVIAAMRSGELMPSQRSDGYQGWMETRRVQVARPASEGERVSSAQPAPGSAPAAQ